ncbi:MAG: MFS transporter [Chloroflexi bacterium]|nr:MFS transporter [Chloroflexota bacterium]
MPSNTFRSLRHRNYRLWFFGQGFSLIGTWMQTMAQQVLVYRLTGSAAALGTVSFIGLIPLLPLALWGGSIADRLPKQRVILITQIIMMIQAFLLAALTLTATVQVWHVYVLALLLAAAQAVDMPTRQAFTVEMVEGKEDLTNAIALNSAIFNGARALGPALAGLAVATTGEGMAFALNGLSFVAVILSLLLMRNLPKPDGARRTSSLTGHMAEGARFVAGQQAILVLMSLVAVSAFLSMPYSTLMPVFADRVLGESAQPVVTFLCGGAQPLMHCQSPQALPLGILLTMVGIGAVTGALLVASLPDGARRGRWLTAGNLAFPFLLLAFAASRSFLLSSAVLVLVGISFVWQNSLANTLLQLITPDAVRGRVMSLYTLSFQSAMRLGGLQAGLMADRFGASLAVGLGAAISLAYGLFIAVRFPKVREMA